MNDLIVHGGVIAMHFKDLNFLLRDGPIRSEDCKCLQPWTITNNNRHSGKRFGDEARILRPIGRRGYSLRQRSVETSQVYPASVGPVLCTSQLYY
jgi:hypothetical protein